MASLTSLTWAILASTSVRDTSSVCLLNVLAEEFRTFSKASKPFKIASFVRPPCDWYKAALATAQSQGGLTKDAILKGFDALLNVLNSSASTFNKQTDEVSRTEVDAKIAQVSDVNEAIQQKQKEIADLQQQVKSLQSQTEVSRSKLQEAKSNFERDTSVCDCRDFTC